jgi:hypothetical protein
MARPKPGTPKEAPTKSAAVAQVEPDPLADQNADSGQAQDTAEEQKVEVCCATPLDYMLSVMRDPTVEPARRDEMAKLALPYLHPKPTAIEHKDGGLIEISDMSKTDIARRIGFMLAQVAYPETH